MAAPKPLLTTNQKLKLFDLLRTYRCSDEDTSFDGSETQRLFKYVASLVQQERRRGEKRLYDRFK